MKSGTVMHHEIPIIEKTPKWIVTSFWRDDNVVINSQSNASMQLYKKYLSGTKSEKLFERKAYLKPHKGRVVSM